jgi:F0F1-type ATP synthase epsilon subunit
MEPKLHVTIKNKESTLFDGDVTAVTSFNETGLFDILPMHENFITLIKTGIILRRGNSQKKINIDHGLLKTRDNNVNIYLGL